MAVKHEYNPDTDRCACDGMVVYFEDGDKDGHHGEGCEIACQVFEVPQVSEDEEDDPFLVFFTFG